MPTGSFSDVTSYIVVSKPLKLKVTAFSNVLALFVSMDVWLFTLVTIVPLFTSVPVTPKPTVIGPVTWVGVFKVSAFEFVTFPFKPAVATIEAAWVLAFKTSIHS